MTSHLRADALGVRRGEELADRLERVSNVERRAPPRDEHVVACEVRVAGTDRFDSIRPPPQTRRAAQISPVSVLMLGW